MNILLTFYHLTLSPKFNFEIIYNHKIDLLKTFNIK